MKRVVSCDFISALLEKWLLGKTESEQKSVFLSRNFISVFLETWESSPNWLILSRLKTQRTLTKQHHYHWCVHLLVKEQTEQTQGNASWRDCRLSKLGPECPSKAQCRGEALSYLFWIPLWLMLALCVCMGVWFIIIFPYEKCTGYCLEGLYSGLQHHRALLFQFFISSSLASI